MDNAKKKNNKMNNHSYNEKYNSRSRIEKLTLTALFTAIAVVGSMFSFPIFGSKCAPVQHLVNVLCAVTVGPWWGLGQAFLAALIRNLTGLGSPLAFPGSMCGALLGGLLWEKTAVCLHRRSVWNGHHRRHAFLSGGISDHGKSKCSTIYICCAVPCQYLRRYDPGSCDHRFDGENGCAC